MKKLFTQFGMIILLAVVLCFIVSCQKQVEKTEIEEMKAKAEVEAQNKKIVHRWVEEMDKGNFEILDELCALDYAAYLYSIAEPLSLEMLKKQIQMFYDVFSDYYTTIEDTIVEGDKVVLRTTLRGTCKGESKGILPTGKEIEYTAITIFRIWTDGKVVETWEQGDRLSLMMQLGMELKPKESEK